MILALVGALVVGLVLGGVVGRLTAPSVSDKVASVQDSARAVVARVRSTPNEYAQQLRGSNEFRGGGSVLDALNGARTSLRSAASDAVWLGRSQRTALDASLDPVVTAARDKVPADRYSQVVEAAAKRIETAFGIDT
jgi:hypothetical protein